MYIMEDMPVFYEVARVELFRNLGFSYKKLEEEGVGMPVIDLETKYILPIKYDEENYYKNKN